MNTPPRRFTKPVTLDRSHSPALGTRISSSWSQDEILKVAVTTLSLTTWIWFLASKPNPCV